MTKATHTPGPWGARISPHCVEVRWAGKPPVVPWIGFDDSDRPCEEHAANARLITAAPDMLAACKEALARILSDIGYVPEAKRLEAAIRRATE